ncbi:MAG: hypothetical protein LBG60_15005 [Bifidobacteriaceae bacterium]|jgi:hypothetical protein|nr:hypothetical protein [Bifidobacteriaceae bacterium]
MATITFDGQTLRAVNFSKAELHHVMALQLESGLSMKQIVELGKASEVFTVAVTLYLSRRTAGIFEPWTRISTMTMEEMAEVQIEREPGDVMDDEAGGQAEENPPVAATPETGSTTDPTHISS